jgi:hypothetical protein
MMSCIKNGAVYSSYAKTLFLQLPADLGKEGFAKVLVKKRIPISADGGVIIIIPIISISYKLIIGVLPSRGIISLI